MAIEQIKITLGRQAWETTITDAQTGEPIECVEHFEIFDDPRDHTIKARLTICDVVVESAPEKQLRRERIRIETGAHA